MSNLKSQEVDGANLGGKSKKLLKAPGFRKNQRGGGKILLEDTDLVAERNKTVSKNTSKARKIKFSSGA